MNKSIEFDFDNNLIIFIKKEVMKYLSIYDNKKVLYAYNRMTVEEIAQEVVLKLYKSVAGDKVNKTYIRRAISFVCIDLYRKNTDQDPIRFQQDLSDPTEDIDITESLLSQSEEETFGDTDIDIIFEQYRGIELKILLLIREGYSNKEIFEKLNMPKVNFYTLMQSFNRK